MSQKVIWIHSDARSGAGIEGADQVPPQTDQERDRAGRQAGRAGEIPGPGLRGPFGAEGPGVTLPIGEEHDEEQHQADPDQAS